MTDPYQAALAREIALMGEPLSPNTAGLNTAEAIEEANEMLAPYGITAADITAGRAETPFYEAEGSSRPGQSGLFMLTDNRFVEQPSSLSVWDKLGGGVSTFFNGGWKITPTGFTPYTSQTDWLKTNVFDNLFGSQSPLAGQNIGSNLTGGISIMMLFFLMAMMNNNRR